MFVGGVRRNIGFLIHLLHVDVSCLMRSWFSCLLLQLHLRVLILTEYFGFIFYSILDHSHLQLNYKELFFGRTWWRQGFLSRRISIFDAFYNSMSGLVYEWNQAAKHIYIYMLQMSGFVFEMYSTNIIKCYSFLSLEKLGNTWRKVSTLQKIFLDFGRVPFRRWFLG